jgi:hypothetical protein
MRIIVVTSASLIMLAIATSTSAQSGRLEGDCSTLNNQSKRLACYDKKSLTTTIPTAQSELSTSDKKVTKGSIRGSVSYYFNHNFGNKPDSGTEVFLLDGDELSIPSASMFFREDDSIILMEKKIRRKRNIQFSRKRFRTEMEIMSCEILRPEITF